ncbi:hypothetical protein [Streptomyces sp. NPDC091371]|uniref:hypothetical protein n=1 Tax=Streptomyces sp. NPDC091371 TaxID=3155303 RepID=UPI0034236EBC
MRMIKASSTPGSLRWDGDELVDAVGGFRRWTPDGVEHASGFEFAYRFDRAVHSASGRWTVVYEERGTKGVLLDGNDVVREVDRSDYCAEDSDYPVALGVLRSGREVLIHCPDAYDVLQIEDLITGERLTPGERAAADRFHSRLSMSPDGRRLLVAGWVWHPHGYAQVFDLEGALRDPAVLDGPGLLSEPAVNCEVASACWLDANRLAVAGSDRGLGPGAESLGTRQLGVWSFADGRWLHRSGGDAVWGTLIACGSDRVVSLTGHPRLVDATTGAVLEEWPEVEVAHREGAYGVDHLPSPVAALHPDGTRLAVAQPTGVAVLELA